MSAARGSGVRRFGISPGLFLYATAALIAMIVMFNTISPPVRGGTHTYSAEFSDVAGLRLGDDVTLTGVRVGKVSDISVVGRPDGRRAAVVEMEVSDTVRLGENVRAGVLHGDMFGLRYVSLDDARGGSTLRDGARIPLERTTPPVDLVRLANGFKPLFDALAPDDVNALSRTVIEAFEGREQAMSELIGRMAVLGSTVAGNSDAFARILVNLSNLLETVDSHRDEITEMMTGIDQITAAIAADRPLIETLVDRGGRTTATLAALLDSQGGALRTAVGDVRSVTATYQAQTQPFVAMLGNSTELAAAINRFTSYGGINSLYMCNFTMRVGPAQANIFGNTHTAVCRR